MLIDEVAFNRPIRGLAFDGVDIWAIATMATQVIVRIDVETGMAIETYEVPDENLYWHGVAFDGPDTMYLLGRDIANGSSLITRAGVATSIPS